MGFIKVTSLADRYRRCNEKKTWWVNLDYIIRFSGKGEGTRIYINEYDMANGDMENGFIDVEETPAEILTRIRREHE